MKTLTLGSVTLALPLEAKDDSNYPYVVDAAGNRWCRVAGVVGESFEDDVSIARLFAASPDLLLAAERLLHYLDVYEDMVTPFHGTDGDRVYAAKIDLHTAIARARGKES